MLVLGTRWQGDLDLASWSICQSLWSAGTRTFHFVRALLQNQTCGCRRGIVVFLRLSVPSNGGCNMDLVAATEDILRLHIVVEDFTATWSILCKSRRRRWSERRQVGQHEQLQAHKLNVLSNTVRIKERGVTKLLICVYPPNCLSPLRPESVWESLTNFFLADLFACSRFWSCQSLPIRWK